MSSKKLKEIAHKGKGKIIGATSDSKIKGFSIDTRSIKEGNLFIALKGPYQDGHKFIKEAEKKGASALVVEKAISSEIPCIVVKDTYEFLENVALENRNKFKGKLVSLTGSNGKTTTKEFIYSLISSEGKCHKTEGNKNNQIGVPLTLCSLEEGYDFSVVEIGTSAFGEIDYLSKLVEPHIALITNAGPSHLKELGSLEKVANEKGSILDHIADNGIAVLPRDSIFYEEWNERAGSKKVISFGFDNNSDLILKNVKTKVSRYVISFTLNYFGGRLECQMPGIGIHNAINACSALAVCLALEIDLKKIYSNLRKVNYPERRLNTHKGINNSLIIDDSYNANPESMKRSLDVLKPLINKKRIFVAGQMGELGTKEKLFHEEICEYAKGKVEEFLCVGKNWKDVETKLPMVGKYFDTKDELLKYLKDKINSESVILVKGSRSAGMDFVSDKLKV